MDDCIKLESAVEKAASGVFRSRNKIWMVLDEGLIRLYKDHTKESCIGCMEVPKIHAVRQTGQKDKREFEIVTAIKTNSYLVDNQELAETWVKSIQNVMKQKSAGSSRTKHQSVTRVSRQPSVTEELEEISSQTPKSIFGVTLKSTRTSRASVSSLTGQDPALSEKSNTYQPSSQESQNSTKAEVTTVPLKTPEVATAPFKATKDKSKTLAPDVADLHQEDKADSSSLPTSFKSNVPSSVTAYPPKPRVVTSVPFKDKEDGTAQSVSFKSQVPSNPAEIPVKPAKNSSDIASQAKRSTNEELPFAVKEDKEDNSPVENMVVEPDTKADRRDITADFEQNKDGVLQVDSVSCNNSSNTLEKEEKGSDNITDGNENESPQHNAFGTEKVNGVGDREVINNSEVEMRKKRNNSENSAKIELENDVDTSHVVMRNSSRSRSRVSGENSFSGRSKMFSDSSKDEKQFRQENKSDDQNDSLSPVLMRKSFKNDTQTEETDEQRFSEAKNNISVSADEPPSLRDDSDLDDDGEEGLFDQEAFLSIFAVDNDAESRLDKKGDNSLTVDAKAFTELKNHMQAICEDGFDLMSHHVSVERPIEVLREFLKAC